MVRSFNQRLRVAFEAHECVELAKRWLAGRSGVPGTLATSTLAPGPVMTWSITEASHSRGSRWVEDKVYPSPQELVLEFLTTFILRQGVAGFGLTPSCRLEIPAAHDGVVPEGGRSREISLLKGLARSGARGFELIVGTSATAREVLEWLDARGYRFVAETRTETRDQLFDGMFPTELVSGALELSLHRLDCSELS